MIPTSELVRSVGHIWLLWAVALLVFSVQTGRGLQHLWRQGWRAWHDDDDGAAYTLSYAMTFPIYGLFMVLIVETSLMLSCKIGTVYAAYAAARAGIVWSGAQPGAAGSGQVQERARTKMRTAAVQALVPFASASPQHKLPSAAGSGGLNVFPYLAAYHAHYDSVTDDGYLTRKYLYATAGTEIESPNLANHAAEDDLSVVVRFKYPFVLPGIGRLLGEKPAGAKFYTATLETRAALQSEKPRSKSGELGIEYRSE